MKAGNTLTQRTFRKETNEVIIRLDISAMVDGQKNGLCHFSSEHSAIGIVKEKGVCYLEYRKNGKITRGNPVHSRYVWLGSQWGLDGKSRYYYSVNGDNFIPFGEDYQLV